MSVKISDPYMLAANLRIICATRSHPIRIEYMFDRPSERASKLFTTRVRRKENDNDKDTAVRFLLSRLSFIFICVA